MEEPSQSNPISEPDDQPPSSINIEVELYDTQALLNRIALQEIQALATRVLAHLPNTGQVRVSIVDDQRMSAAHEQFSGITGTTDVLTFDLAIQTNNYEQKVIDTDLTVCFDQAQRQAKEHNHTVDRELLLYIIHGTLHCLGYNDHDDADYQRMHKKEDELLAQVGIEPTFFTDTQQSHKGHKS